ncbi:MAG TPA: hypothetical protein DCQ92_02280 [Verrucomicrobia subdivision 3 bacterium]|nr:hypothetical protein [Limisphaerales bacterium]
MKKPMKSFQILFGVVVLLLTQPAPAAPTRQELIDYAKTTWELTDLTDDVISQTLDTSYSGIPYKDYVSYFIVAPSVLNPLLSGDYKTAGNNAANFAADQSISFLLEEAGLSGVSAPARLAAWPIEQGLNSFQNAVKEASFKNQILLYFAARSAGNSYDDVVALQNFDLMSADRDILIRSDLITKIDGWLAYSTSYLVGSVPGYTPAQFYDYAEQQWQSFVATKSYADDEAIIKDAFRAAAAPQKPVITQQPQDTVIASGQNATFTVQATGAGTLTYQWFFNGAWLSPAVGSSLQASAAGQYQVIVGNAAGTTPSRIATLTVNAGEPVAITAPPASANVSGSVTVRASVSGATKVEFYLDGVRQFTDSSTPFAWTWNTAIAANTSHALTANAYNGATLLGTSAAVNVTVNNAAPPACSDPNEPNDSSSTATPLAFGVAANGYVCTATDVDWFKVEVATPGVLTFDLTVPAANDYDIELFGPDYAYIKGSYRDTGLAENITHDATSTGTYYVRVYGYPAGNGSHNAAVPYTLTAGVVSGPVTILTPPQNRAVPAGASASFSVIASGAPLLAYQWQRDNVDIPGATGPTYITPILALGDLGAQFRVRVTNAFGFALSAPATLTVNTANVITWTGAVSSDWNNRTNWNPMSVPTGSDVVNINAVLNIPSSAVFAVLNVLGGRLYGTFTNTGTMTWLSGALSGQLTVAAGAVLNLSGNSDRVFGPGSVLNNAGTVRWTDSGRLYGYDGYSSGWAYINNLAGALFDVQGSGGFDVGSYYGIPFVFTNAGTLLRTVSTNTSAFNYVNFYNTGLVESRSGTLNFSYSFNNSGVCRVQAGTVTVNGGSSGGSFDVAIGAVLQLGNGNYTFSPSAVFTGAGRVSINGNLSGSGPLNGSNLFWEGGRMYGTFTNIGTLNWLSGALSGQLTVAAGAVLNLSGNNDREFGPNSVLNNAGTVRWTDSGRLYGYDGYSPGLAYINNLAGALFDVQGNGGFDIGSYYGIPFVFTNAGILRKTGGAGTTSFSGITFNNTGTVDIQSGTVSFNNGFTQTAAGTLQMEVGGLTPGSGFGRLVVNGQATLAGALNVTLINSFTPGFGDAFSVLSYNSRIGNFASINLPALPNALALTAQYNSSSLTLLTVNGGGNNQTNAFQITRASNGLTELRFTGEPNHTYRLQASTNLVNWLNISTNTPVNGLLRFVDPDAASTDHRFYRAVSP